MAKDKDEELVQWGKHELKKGKSLNYVEDAFLKEGLPKKEAITALKKADASKKIEDRKAASEGKTDEKAVSSAKSSWWLYIFILLVLLALIYLYFSGTIQL